MQKYCGLLKRVGAHTSETITTNGPVGHVRLAGNISVIEIGDAVLRKPRCTSDLHDLLDPGREACLYVYKHFFYQPVVLGVKYAEDNKKYTITFGECVANALSYVFIWPLLFIVSGFMIGLMGGKEGGFMASFGVLWIVGGIILSLVSAVLLLVSYTQMQAD